ncbi:MAG: HDOD domain-containing protein [Gammaproteobacteria bacterium]|nr:HDOD domain-containing protein [Gammaproteobacteria bacterium]
MSDVFVGRQPIYNRHLGIFAYELLFHADAAASNSTVSADDATSQTIINTFIEIGLENIVGNSHACINLTRSFLLHEDKLLIPNKQVILEVLEDIPVTDELIVAMRQLHQQGFTFTLDDYIYNPAHAVLLEMASIIKINISALSQAEVHEHVKQLRPYNKKLLADKVETLDDYDFCMELGFDYFQGYFLSRPRIIRGASLPQNKVAIMKILALLQNQDADIDDINQLISADATISYKILKLMNSAFFSFDTKIDSVKQALLLMGRQKLSSWASMSALSQLDDRPAEMLHIAMTRAKMCELLARQARLQPVENYFTAGLFSALDILMGQPLDSLLKPLPVSDDLRLAIIDRKGVIGYALDCTLAYQTSDWKNVKFLNLSIAEISSCHLQAIKWTLAIMKMM